MPKSLVFVVYMGTPNDIGILQANLDSYQPTGKMEFLNVVQTFFDGVFKDPEGHQFKFPPLNFSMSLLASCDIDFGWF